MARGGKREGAGRKPGIITEVTRTRAAAEKAATEGPMPLEMALAIARDSAVEPERRDKMIIATLPFTAPRLQTTTLQGNPDAPLAINSVIQDNRPSLASFLAEWEPAAALPEPSGTPELVHASGNGNGATPPLAEALDPEPPPGGVVH